MIDNDNNRNDENKNDQNIQQSEDNQLPQKIINDTTSPKLKKLKKDNKKSNLPKPKKT